MVVDTHRETEHYLDLFKGYVLKSSRRSLLKVQQAGAVLPPGEEKQAIHTLSYALKLPEAWRETKALLLVMAPKMEQAGRRDEWMPYLEQGIRQSQQLDDAATEAELHLQLGILYRLRSHYEAARTHLEAAAAGFEALNMPQKQACTLNRLAYLDRVQRRFAEAIRLVETAQRLLTEQDEEWAFGEYVLGLVAMDKRDWPQAVTFSERAFARWQAADNWRMMGRSLLCRGVSLQEMEQYPAAIKAHQQAVALFEKVHDSFFKAIAQMNLGIVYYMLDQYQQALVAYLAAEKIFRDVQDLYHLGLVTHNLGRLYRRLEQWDRAKEAYRTSIELKQKTGDIVWMIDTMDGLGLVYLAEGDLSKAKETFQKAIAWLPHIDDPVWHDELFEMLSTHLEEIIHREKNS